MGICTVEGCCTKSKALGLCYKHYQRLKKNGHTGPTERTHGSLQERFARKVERLEGGCWLWRGNKTKAGYGRIQEGGKGSRTVSAHRVSFEIANGPIPDGMVVCHSCDTPSCVNPAHLFLGTPAENTADMIRKGRSNVVAPKGEGNGKSVLTADAVRLIRASSLNNYEMARRLGVSPNAVRGVRIGRTWAHVK